MQKTKSLKICAGASAGGHMNQLLLLLEQSHQWPVRPTFYVTTMPELSKMLEKYGRTYVIGECNRHRPLDTLKVIKHAFRIIMKEKPNLIITTGSMPIAMLCLVGKLFGAKVIWIDSVANSERFSLSGRLMIYFSDLFLTQWPMLSEKSSKAEYAGEII
jgi:UDP-N-acetylglucosamine:LPS N-acetylglucosamine transferase